MKPLICLAMVWWVAAANVAGPSEPIFPGKSWQEKPPAELGLDATRLESLAVALGGRGCVVKAGYVVKTWGDQAEKSDWLSSAKPVLSTLLMFAMQEGKVKSADAPIADFGWPLSLKDRGITFRHLANMTSGYARPEGPGEAWAYNDFAIQLYQQTLFDRVFQEDPDAAANAAHRLGALELQDGLTFTPGKRRLKASTRDFARIGWFWMNRGKWGEKQLLPARYFDEFMRPQTPKDLPVSRKAETNDYLQIGTFGGGSEHFTQYGAGIYGFNWWFNETGRDHASERTWPDAPPDTVMSIGFGGNCSVLMPKLGLVVVCAKGDWGKLEAGKRESALNQKLKLIASLASRATVTPRTLKVGVAQVALEPTLAANREKIAAFIQQAKSRGCRVVVFPETALFWPPGTPKAEIDAAVESLRTTVAASDLYALIVAYYQRDGKEKPFERLLVIDPQGRIVQDYHKMWGDARFNDCPGLFQIDGVPCAAAICADRWIRSVEELPAIAGAKILFECSNNYANEWLPELGHYWYVPRALRNEAFVVFANTAKEDRGQHTPGHGHSAVIGPAGQFLAAAGEESDKLLVAELDLSQATGGQAMARRNHPALRPFWEAGVAMLAGKTEPTPKFEPLTSPQIEIKIAAAQMACSRKIEDNVAHMIKMIRSAAAERADIVVFPELALTGAIASDIAAVKQADLEAAAAQIQQAAAAAEIHVAFGLPWHEGADCFNCALVVGPDGRQLTRYKQLVVDRPDQFAPGKSTSPMWFTVRGVPCVVTIGRDALWSEIAEMAAWRGAQVHLHLAHAGDDSPAAALVRRQLWANIASFRTFTATVNAASPKNLKNPSSPASGGSMIWDDYHRASSGKAGGYAPHSAVRLAEAQEAETILYAQQKIPRTNPLFKFLTGSTNRTMTAWYATGVTAIAANGEAVNEQAEAKPPEKDGGGPAPRSPLRPP